MQQINRDADIEIRIIYVCLYKYMHTMNEGKSKKENTEKGTEKLEHCIHFSTI